MQQRELAQQKVSILIVEDDAEVRCLLQRELQDRGSAVTSADDAAQALEALARQTYTVVITDIKMPGMDGVELTRLIKQRTPETEVIIITGFASVESAAEAVRLGASDYLTKPLSDIDRLHHSVERALDQYRQRQRMEHRMLTLEALRSGLSSLLDRLPLGIVLLDSAGRVLQINNRGRGLIDSLEGLSIDQGSELVQGHSKELSLLRRLISRAVGSTMDQDGRVGGVATLVGPRGLSELSCCVTPVNIDGDTHVAEGPAAAVFVSDPEQRVETTEGLLCRLYSLTPTEGRLAAILMQGKSVERAAAEMQISTNTARTHLKRVFAKTQTSRQGDLISLLLSGPALLRLDRVL